LYLNKETSLERKKEIIADFVKFCKKIQKSPRIAFTGGEPFALREQLFDLLQYCEKEFGEVKKCILTNGTMIRDTDFERLKKLNIDYIQVSLDGATEETHDYIRGKNAFQRAIGTLKKLNAVGIRTAVMFVFHRANYRDVPELIELCDRLNVSSLGITEFVPEGRGKGIFELMLTPQETRDLYKVIIEKQIELMKRGSKLRIDMKRPLWVLLREGFPGYESIVGGGCAAGFSGLALMPNEDVMPCRRMNVVIGNLKDSTFFDIWYSSELLWKLRNRAEIGECSQCKFNMMCGGCKAVSFAVKGDFFKKDPICWYVAENRS
jgi:radical SAM protein with 4Fe4S-binding SPASM domain